MIRVLFKGFLAFLIVTLAFYLSPVPLAHANPLGGNVSSGSATIATSGKTETIDQTTSKAVIDWTGFNIGADEATKFVQPNSSSLTVNRVHDMNPSQILGSLTANGNLVLINPNGVFFGPGSKIDVNGLLATTSNVANSDVMSGGTLRFTPGSNPNAAVINAGTITAADAGLVGLVAPNVQNSGVITARLGKVQLSSGDSFDLDFYGDNLLKIGVSDAVGQQIVQNLGSIEADGGKVLLTAAAGRSIVNSLIDVEGEIKTPSFKQKNGEIEIYAAGSNAVPGNVAANKGEKNGSSTVTVSGELDASGYGAGQTGGNISVLGDNVGILNGAILDASGDQGGGNIKIGGDFHGAGNTPTALDTRLNPDSLILANAITSGNGGNVAVWSDQFTTFSGQILARGGQASGNGGYVETSGHQTLDMQGQVDASAPHGIAGTWLMDPEDVNITTTDSDDTGSDGASTFGPGGNQATASVNAQYIVDALNAGTNVTVTTTGSGAAGSQSGPNGGSITVSSPISATGAGTALTTTGSLTLSSFKDILINAAITLGGGTNTSNQTVTGGVVTLDAANSGNSIGAISVGANITTNGGNITMGGNEANPASIVAETGYATGDLANGIGINIGGNLNAGGGNILLNGFGYSASSNGLYGISVGSDTLQTIGSGAITLNGTGGNGGAAHEGVALGSSTTLSSVDGAITINGTAGGSAEGIYDVLSTIQATGNGAISLTGLGGSSAGWNTNGIHIYGGTISTKNGNILLSGTGGAANAYGIYFQYGGATVKTTGTGSISLTGIGSGTDQGIYINQVSPYGADTIGSGTESGNITFTTDTLGMTNSATIQTTGNVTFAPYTPSTNINVATGSTGLQITSGTGSILADTTAGSITIGAVGDTGTMTVGANTWSMPLALVSGSGVITISGAQTMGSNNFTLQSDATPTFNSTVTTTGNVLLEPASSSTTVGVEGGTGIFSIGSSILNNVSAGSITLGNASGAGNIDIGAYNPTASTTFQNGSGNITFDLGGGTMAPSSGDSITATTSSGNITTASTGTISTTRVSSGGNITLTSGNDIDFNNTFTLNPANNATLTLNPSCAVPS